MHHYTVRLYPAYCFDVDIKIFTLKHNIRFLIVINKVLVKCLKTPSVIIPCLYSLKCHMKSLEMFVTTTIMKTVTEAVFSLRKSASIKFCFALIARQWKLHNYIGLGEAMMALNHSYRVWCFISHSWICRTDICLKSFYYGAKTAWTSHRVVVRIRLLSATSNLP